MTGGPTTVLVATALAVVIVAIIAKAIMTGTVLATAAIAILAVAALTRRWITDAGVALSIFRATGTIGLRVVTGGAATVLATIALTVVVVGARDAPHRIQHRHKGALIRRTLRRTGAVFVQSFLGLAVHRRRVAVVTGGAMVVTGAADTGP